VPLIFFEFAFKALLERERIRSCAREAGQNFVVIQTADFTCRPFDDDVAQRDLAIAT
jgi:hypothetical protein